MNPWLDHAMPYSNGILEDSTYKDDKGHLSNVHTPELLPFLLDSKETAPAVIIFPGGGYGVLSSFKEGTDVAKWLNSFGINAFVLNYRLPNINNLTQRECVPLSDAQRAIKLIRSRSKEYNINPDKIGVIGFSAGGHLASTLMTQFAFNAYKPLDKIDSISAKPDFNLLIYPVITLQEETYKHGGSKNNLLGINNESPEIVNFFSAELNVRTETGPTFVVHAQDDEVVPLENSIMIYKALIDKGIPTELHIYATGGHGFGLDQTSGTALAWPDLAKKWLLDQLAVIA